MRKFYSINPGSVNGKLCWYIKYYDGYEETVPFEPTENVLKRIKEKTNKYLLKIRLNKICKLQKKFWNK